MASAAAGLPAEAEPGGAETTEAADSSTKLDSSTSTSDDTVKTSIPRIALIDEHERRRSLDSGSSARSSQSSDHFFGSVLAPEPLAEEPAATSPPLGEDTTARRLAEENGHIEHTLQQILRDEEALKLKYQKLRQLERDASNEWSQAEDAGDRADDGAVSGGTVSSGGAADSGGSGGSGGSGSGGDRTRGSGGGSGGGGWVSPQDQTPVKKSPIGPAEPTERVWLRLGASSEEDVRAVSPAGRPARGRRAPPPITGWDTLPETLIGDGDGDYSTLERLTPGSHDSLLRSRECSYSPFSLLSTPCHSFLAGPVYTPTGDLPDLTRVDASQLETEEKLQLQQELDEPEPTPEPEPEPEAERESRSEPGSVCGRPLSIVEHPAWGQISDLDRALAFMEATGPTDCRQGSQRWTDIDDVLSVLEADGDVRGGGAMPPVPMRDSRVDADDGYPPLAAGRGRTEGGPPQPEWGGAPHGRALGLVGYSAAGGGLGPHRSAAKPEPPRPCRAPRALSVSAELNRRVRSLQRARTHSLLSDAHLSAGGRIRAVHQHIVQSTNEMPIPGRSTPATVHSYQEMVIKQVIDSTLPAGAGPDGRRAAPRPAAATDASHWRNWPPTDEPPAPAFAADVPPAPATHDPSGMHYPSYVSARDFDALARAVDAVDVSDTDLSAHESAGDERVERRLFPPPDQARAVTHRSAFRPIRPEPLRPAAATQPRLLHHLPIASAGPAPMPPPPAGHGEPGWDAGCGRSSTLPRARPRQPAERGRRSKSERRRRKELRHSERRLRRVRYGRTGVAGYRQLTIRRGRRDPDFGFSVIGGPEAGLGVFVSRLEPDGLARSAGLRVGDELIIVNGYDVRRLPSQQVQQMLSSSALLDILIKTMGNGDNYVVSHTYTWCDPQGREVTPPPDVLHTSRQGGHDRKVDFSLEMGESLGLTIRGGAEYGLGIFVTGVDLGSAADQAGIQVGDQILDVNNQSFLDITHDEAVSILKYCKTPIMTIRPVGKVPCASYPASDSDARFQTAITHSSGGAAPFDWSGPGAAAGRPHPRSEAAPPAPDEWADPALVMVYEKASVLLGGHEFGVFDELVRRYLAGHVDVTRLVGSLLELFRSPEKLTLLTELREIISPVDQLQFDQMVYHADRRRPFEQSRLVSAAITRQAAAPGGGFDNRRFSGLRAMTLVSSYPTERTPLLVTEASGKTTGRLLSARGWSSTDM